MPRNACAILDTSARLQFCSQRVQIPIPLLKPAHLEFLKPGWRNWQTQRTQNPPTARSWGFDPPSRHQISIFKVCCLRAAFSGASSSRGRAGSNAWTNWFFPASMSCAPHPSAVALPWIFRWDGYPLPRLFWQVSDSAGLLAIQCDKCFKGKNLFHLQ
jgi:hypothetical protein